MRSAVRAAVVGLALVATVLVPCLCAAMPASTAANHACCANETGLAPAVPDCCACAMAPASDLAVAAASAQHSSWATALSSGHWTNPAAAPAAKAAPVEHVVPPPRPLRV